MFLGSKTLTITNGGGDENQPPNNVYFGDIQDGGIGGGKGGNLTIAGGFLDVEGTLSYTGTTTIDPDGFLVVLNNPSRAIGPDR